MKDNCFTMCWFLLYINIISHRHGYVPSLLNLPPTPDPHPPRKVVKEHQVEFPVLYSKFPLAILFSRGFSQTRVWTQVSCTAGRFFTVWTIKEAIILYRVHLKCQRKILLFFGKLCEIWKNLFYNFFYK